jgi:hypothetical protein
MKNTIVIDTNYRFDDAYEKVYEYDRERSAYVFFATYLALGIKPKMRNKTKLQLVYAHLDA